MREYASAEYDHQQYKWHGLAIILIYVARRESDITFPSLNILPATGPVSKGKGWDCFLCFLYVCGKILKQIIVHTVLTRTRTVSAMHMDKFLHRCRSVEGPPPRGARTEIERIPATQQADALPKLIYCILYFCDQRVTKRCRLSYLTNSALVLSYLIIWAQMRGNGRGGVAGYQPMSTAVHMEPN